jgi:hypothetical protein
MFKGHVKGAVTGHWWGWVVFVNAKESDVSRGQRAESYGEGRRQQSEWKWR